MRNVSSINRSGSVVGMRVDIETDVEDGEIVNKAQHKAHATTIQELVDAGTKVVLFAHDTSGIDGIMQMHAEVLDQQLNDDVNIFCGGERTVDELTDSMSSGDVAVYQNLNNTDNAMINYNSIRRSYESSFTRRISKSLDAFVNDSFSLIHDNYPTVTGIPSLVPGYGGNLMTAEYQVLTSLKNNNSDFIFVFGGKEVDSRLKSMEFVLEGSCSVDAILTGGVVGTVFLIASGYELGDATREDIEPFIKSDSIQRASEILTMYGDKIELPVDVAIGTDDRKEFDVGAAPYQKPISDIGSATIEKYNDIVLDGGSTIATGPLGVAEEEPFSYGTKKVYETISDTDKSIISGSTTASLCENYDIKGFRHTSTSHTSLCKFLSSDTVSNGVKVLLPRDNTISDKEINP